MKIGTILSFILSILGIALRFAEISAASKYCAASLCGGSKHIACNNNGALASTCSKDAKLIKITPAIRTKIVNKHNEYRNNIAKGGYSGFAAAARMASMKWNAELAKIATYNVKQCVMKHDTCRNTNAFKSAGQNLAYMGWSGTTRKVEAVILNGMEMWFNEYKNCTMVQINKYADPPNKAVIGHFTQLVQEKATDVGCAVLRQTKNGFTEQYLACNYARTNFIDSSVYTTAAKAASKCTTGVNRSFKYLCSLKEKYNVNAV